MLDKLIRSFIMHYMQNQLKKLSKKQYTPYVFIYGTGKNFPKYLMYTGNQEIRDKMHSIL